MIKKNIGIGLSNYTITIHLYNKAYSFLIMKWFVKKYYFDKDAYKQCVEYELFHDIYFFGLILNK